MQGYYKMELQQSRKYRKSTVRGLLAIEKREKLRYNTVTECKFQLDF